VVALSLVGAPATMADWEEQAGFDVDPVAQSDVRNGTPVLRYENLSSSAQEAVRRAIESEDGYYTVYGREDWPDRFFYSDYSEPGHGMYAVVYRGEYYRLTTYASGGFPFVYWLLELPFVVYGLLLLLVGYRTGQGKRSPGTAVLATVPGVGFHLLGPEFDFPLLGPWAFVLLGIVATMGLATGLLWTGRS
ncbi:MAG: hypothetical protein V5A33_06590, partial [Halobacteriales archaeon]